MKLFLLSLMSLIVIPGWANSDTTALKGYWLNEKEGIVVEIYFIDEELRGRIVWIEEELDDFNQPKRDVMNRQPNLRSRKVMGMDVFYGFEEKNGVWKNGKVYNYLNGHQYNAKIKLDDNGNLQWTGYYGILIFLSSKKKWERVIDKQKYNLD